MTIEDNIQVVKTAYAAFGRGDVPGLIAMLTDDVQWEAPGEGLMLSGKYRGRDGAAQFFQKLGQSLEMLAFEPREFVAQGDRVIVLGSEKVKIKSTNRTLAVDWVMVFTVRGGKVASFTEYTDTQAFATAEGIIAKAAS